MRLKKILVAGVAGVAWTQVLFSLAQAVPHVDESKSSLQNTCNVSAKASAARQAIYAAGLKAGKFAPPISATTYKLIVLRVDFSDKVMTKSKTESESLFTRLAAFYRENSYGLVTVNCEVSSTVYRMPRTHDFYANGINSAYSTMVNDAVALANTAGTDFTQYDHIMIYHAGEGAETASVTSDYIWSVYVDGTNAGVAGTGTIDGKAFYGATFVPEKEFQDIDPLGVTCHEYGHQLGLPDLYQNPTTSAVGSWDLMDSGIYVGNPRGSSPSHFGAWSKLFLGYSSPETVSLANGETKTLKKSNTNRSAFLRLPIGTSDVGASLEYFLLEYRSTSGSTYDTALPASGIIIWHVDDSLTTNSHLAANNVNSNSARRAVDVVESDITDPSLNYGDSGDPWISGTFTAPKSNANNGLSSGVSLTSFSGVGTSEMSFLVGNISNNPSVTSNVNSITAIGGQKGYLNAKVGEEMNFTAKPNTAGTVTATVYTLSGSKVWSKSQSAAANSSVQIFWDGKNNDGRIVASGIYILHMMGGGVNSSRKIAVLNSGSAQ